MLPRLRAGTSRPNAWSSSAPDNPAQQAVATLRAEGFAGAITMVGDEPFAPYQRPPLSKTYLIGTMERDRLFLKPDAFYEQAQCQMITGVPAVSINRAAKEVSL